MWCAQVLACSPDGVSFKYAQVGVRGCELQGSLDTRTGGVYTLEFMVTNSAGLSAYANRTVTVISSCPQVRTSTPADSIQPSAAVAPARTVELGCTRRLWKPEPAAEAIYPGLVKTEPSSSARARGREGEGVHRGITDVEKRWLKK